MRPVALHTASLNVLDSKEYYKRHFIAVCRGYLNTLARIKIRR